MPVTLQTNASQKFKSSFAPSTNVGLCVRANGDETVAVIDPFGFMVPAGIPAPTTAPTCANGTSQQPGYMNNGKWVAYAYCWAASRRYPYVEGDSIGGNLYPRGNPSPASASFNITNGQCDVTFALPDNVTVVPTTVTWVRSDIDRVWLFRTLDFDNQADCDVSAAAGDFYYVDEYQVPPGTGPGQTFTYTDRYQTPTDDIAEYDNYEAPMFQFCVYVDPYWYGFGNFPLKVAATWDADGTVHLDPTDPNTGYRSGRDGQGCFIKATATDGDVTNATRQYFCYGVDFNTCILRLDNDQTPVANFQPGSGFIIFNGPSTTLYRSKYRNPMAWGTTSFVGDIRVPAQFFLKVGGGVGTGIAQVPNLPLLVLSTKGPAAMYTLDLRAAGTDTFAATLKTISTLFSVTSHFSQYAAMQPNGRMLLYGYDGENKAIIACDGNSVVTMSDPWLSATMRMLSTDPTLERNVHGLYDPTTQHNCMWLPLLNAEDTMNLLVSQSSVTGNWHTQFEGDVLCSAFVEGTFCALREIYVGTFDGNFGLGLDTTKTRNWVYDQFTPSGQFIGADPLVLQTAIPADAPGILGTWMLVTDANGGGDQWGRISLVSPDGTQVAIDRCWSPGNGNTAQWVRDPVVGDAYYIGLIECSLLHFFDFNAFADDKKLEELWLSMDGVDPANPTFFQFVRDRGTVAGRGQNYYVNTSDGVQSTIIPVEQSKYDDGVTSQQWGTTTPPTERNKVFGLRVVDRGYGPWRLYGWGGKRA